MSWREHLPGLRRPSRDRRLTFEHDTLIWTGVAALAGGAVIAFGLYNVAARSGHWAVTGWALHTTYIQSVRLRSALDAVHAEDAPDLADIALIQRGAGHFQGGCYPCHSAPGRAQDLVALSMVPQPPHVTDAIDGWNADQLNWILWNGVKMSGMPGWPADARREEVWAVVAFLQAVPGMTEAEYDALVFGEAAPPPEPTGSAALEALHRGPEESALGLCVRCHAEDGRGRGTGAFPRLDLLTPEYIAAQLRAYKIGHRHSGIMQPVAYALTEEEIAALAEHYGSGGPAPVPSPRAPDDAELIARGREIAGGGDLAATTGGEPACAACHGPWPEPRDRRHPSLAGQHANYVEEQLVAWSREERGGSPLARLMHPVAHAIEREDMAAVAAYYAALPAHGAQPAPRDLAPVATPDGPAPAPPVTGSAPAH